ncbi:toll/interleukin-1 receptor domain-containing protein [Cupriavidus taiwanensis]|uniref:toll/interleukin-1 receptor domain-containing protein n=1 Tax=Cupriavidus taiwanensis TaxID=164546 RepID=UPI000E2FB4AE|nr:toll/interleukin-1 receptor domain-containing protein [Cupriavidus taiwanensis]
MLPAVFLSHNHADKPFVRRLAADLESQGIRYWLDEAEIKIGESLIEKIRDGIDRMDYVVVVLSPDSVASSWVQREVDVAMNQEILGRRVKVLPVMFRRCDPPGFLLGKRYADFSDGSRYAAAFEDLVRSLGVVFNRNAFDPPAHATHLGEALDKAYSKALPVLSRPFHRPFQYMGMTIQDAARVTGGMPNDVGNILLDSDECHMSLEAEGNYISYVDIELKRTAPHRQDQEFDSEVVLGALSISPSELELVRKKIHSHTYYDHRKRLKISVSCLYDGAPLSVGFSSKYYGM